MSEKEQYYVIEKQTIEMNPLETDGLILDIGGGGEGIIGKLNGRKVVAVDTRIEELIEAKNDSMKIVMDATDLKFTASAFALATSFFSFMYIKNDNHPKVFKEIGRVLKRKGRLLIWDVKIPQKQVDKSIFALFLQIVLPTAQIETGYGVKWEHKKQDLKYFKELAISTEFKIADEWVRGEIFYLELIKD
jgi:ubiquinone/menaquinone biosynthesis C-methylase UbiE